MGTLKQVVDFLRYEIQNEITACRDVRIETAPNGMRVTAYWRIDGKDHAYAHYILDFELTQAKNKGQDSLDFFIATCNAYYHKLTDTGY